MSYFEYFQCNILNENSESIRGTCYSMCPQEETNMRIRENLVHVLEVLGSDRKLVKCYSRSAADSNLAVPESLRAAPALRDTVQYLLLEVTKRRDVSKSMVYDFVNDRLRAVRQDMTIQRLVPEEVVRLLEPMVRFYVYYGYELCEIPINNFDPVLNKKYLLECLKWILWCYDTISSKNSGSVDELTNTMTSLSLDKKYKFTPDRVLMESLYLLCNLDDLHPLLRYLGLTKHLKCAKTLHLSYQIAIANLKGNYIKVCQLMEQLCPLTYCAVCVYLPVLQRRGLDVMCHGYHSKQLTVPIGVLQRWLCFESGADAAMACRHYGLQCAGDATRFAKGEFQRDAVTLPPKKRLLGDKINVPIDKVFTYRTP